MTVWSNIDLSIGVIDPSVQPFASDSWEGRMARYSSYEPSFGNTKLRALIACTMQVTEDHIAITAGASMALTATFAFLRNAGSVLIPKPCFPGYLRTLKALGMAFEGYEVPIDLSPFEALCKTIKCHSHAGSVVINNPGNPLGTIMTDDEITTLISLATSQGMVPILDQTYHDLAFENDAVLAPKVVFPNSIQIFSFSKAPRLAGIRLGYIRAKPDTLEAIMDIHSGMTLGVSQPSEEIAIASFDKIVDPSFLAERRFLRRARDLCLRLLDGSRVRTSLPKASPLVWIELPNATCTSSELAIQIRRKLGVEVEVGDKFGVFDRTTIRCGFAIPHDIAEFVFSGIAHVCNEAQQENAKA